MMFMGSQNFEARTGPHTSSMHTAYKEYKEWIAVWDLASS